MAEKEFPMYGRPTREPAPPSPLEQALPEKVSHADLRAKGQPPQSFSKSDPLPRDYPGGPATKGHVK
jgi:hypothetical protein